MLDDPFWQAVTAKGAAPSPTFAAFHRGGRNRSYAGHVEVTVGSSWIAKTLLRLGNFPQKGGSVVTRLDVTCNGSETKWLRRFGDHETMSLLCFDLQSGLVIERMGHLEMRLSPSLDKGRMLTKVVSLRCFGVPIPKWIIPSGDAVETEVKEGRIGFDIQGKLPLLGTLIRYRGEFFVPLTDAVPPEPITAARQPEKS